MTVTRLWCSLQSEGAEGGGQRKRENGAHVGSNVMREIKLHRKFESIVIYTDLLL